MSFASLEGKVTLVTGVTGGLGKTTARTFAERGAQVVGMARRSQPGKALEKEAAAAGYSLRFVVGDVTDEDDCRRAVDRALQMHGRIDILINNAGITGEIASASEIRTAEWHRVVDVNLNGTFYMCRHALPHMRDRKTGVIINIASVNAVIAFANMSAYNAAKAAVVHYSRSLAVECIDDGVRVNAIILGGFASEMQADTAREIGKSVNGAAWEPAQSASKRWGMRAYRTRDAARALAVLCSDEAALINASAIAIDGGVSAGLLSSQMSQLTCAELLPD